MAPSLASRVLRIPCALTGGAERKERVVVACPWRSFVAFFEYSSRASLATSVVGGKANGSNKSESVGFAFKFAAPYGWMACGERLEGKRQLVWSPIMIDSSDHSRWHPCERFTSPAADSDAVAKQLISGRSTVARSIHRGSSTLRRSVLLHHRH